MSILQVSQNNACHDTHTSLPITRVEEHNRARMKVEEGVHLALEARQRSEEEEEHTRIEAEEEARLVEEERLKSEEAEENLRLKAEEEHHTWLKAEER